MWVRSLVRSQGGGFSINRRPKILAKTGLGKDRTDMEGQRLVKKRARRRGFVPGHSWERLDGHLLILLRTTWSHFDVTWNHLCRQKSTHLNFTAILTSLEVKPIAAYEDFIFIGL